MVDPIGTTLGAAGLAMQLLDSAVKGYVFFLAVQGFPEAYLDARTKFEIESRRILDFAEAAKILHFEDDVGTIPQTLRKDHLVLVSIFTRIRAKIDSLLALTARYDEVNPDGLENDSEVEVSDLNVKEQYTKLCQWERTARKREHKKGLNHILRAYQVGKDVVKHPKRLRWATFDEDIFMSTVRNLAEYNDALERLLQDEHRKRLEDATTRTYLELVLVRRDLRDLRSLRGPPRHQRVTNGVTPCDSSASATTLEVMTQTKQLVVLNDAEDGDRLPGYEEINMAPELAIGNIHFESGLPASTSATEPGRLRSLVQVHQSGSTINAFVEWKTYTPVNDDVRKKPVPKLKNLERVKGLVALLQSSRLDYFSTPKCLGFFDLRDHPQGAELLPWFGVVYDMSHAIPPTALHTPVLPVSLLSRLGQDRPSLSVRVKLAYTIANSVLYFNSVSWYHKTLRSDAIIFYPGMDDKVDLTKPYVTGFEYARPGDHGEHTTHVPETPETDLYVHPDYQEAKGGYARSYDIYSLGIILLEIAHWRPVREILAADFPKNAIDALRVRDILLSNDKLYLKDVQGHCGNRYFEAVYGCIHGLVGDDEDEEDVKVAYQLQDAFLDKVVVNLEALQDL